LRNLRECNLDRLLQLRISSGDNIGRSDLNIEIGCNACVLNPPGCATWIVSRAIRQLHATTIDKNRGEVVRANATAERAFADDWTNLRELEHKGASLGSRTVQFIDDHYLHGRGWVNGSRNIVAAAKHVIVKRLALHPFDQIVGCDAAAIEPLIDNDALF